MDSEKFLVKLIEFYKDTLTSSAIATRKLADLQHIFPEEYEMLKQITFDPTQLPDLLEKLDDTSRGILVDIYLKQDVLSKKGIMLFQMSVDEKRKYADELESFGILVDEKIKRLIENAKLKLKSK